MGEQTFSLTVGIVFLLSSLAHLARILIGAPVVVQDIPIPIWASGVAAVVTGFLSYECFRCARKSPSKQEKDLPTRYAKIRAPRVRSTSSASCVPRAHHHYYLNHNSQRSRSCSDQLQSPAP